MMKPISEPKLLYFLHKEGFRKAPSLKSGHQRYRKGAALVQWRKLDGRQTMLLIWEIERAGYERKFIKQQLGLLEA